MGKFQAPPEEAPMKPTRTPRRQFIIEAIDQMTLISVDYDRHHVIVAPHIYGVDDQGEEMLHGWVVPDPLGRWTTEILSEARIVQPINQRFAGPHIGYSKSNSRFAEIFAAL